MRKSPHVITEFIAYKSRIDLDRCNIIVSALEKCKLREENRDLFEDLLVRLVAEDLDLGISQD